MSDIRVSPERIDDLLAKCEPKFHVVPETTLTICTLVLPNGHSVCTGQAACVDPDNFNRELGEEYALEDAWSKAESIFWDREGWRLMMEVNPV